MHRSQYLVAESRQPANAGFDLSHSKTWTSMKGLPKEGVILGFSNITESKDMPIQFVEYLQFE